MTEEYIYNPEIIIVGWVGAYWISSRLVRLKPTPFSINYHFHKVKVISGIPPGISQLAGANSKREGASPNSNVVVW